VAAHPSGTVRDGNPVPSSPLAPSGQAVREDLAGLDDLALLRLVQSLPRASQRRMAACELLVSRYETPQIASLLFRLDPLGVLVPIGHPFADLDGAAMAVVRWPIYVVCQFPAWRGRVVVSPVSRMSRPRSSSAAPS
jgi:hypothetical protein